MLLIMCIEAPESTINSLFRLVWRSKKMLLNIRFWWEVGIFSLQICSASSVTTVWPTAKLLFFHRLLPTERVIRISISAKKDALGLLRFLCIFGCDVSTDILCRFSSGWTASRSLLQPLVLATIPMSWDTQPGFWILRTTAVLLCLRSNIFVFLFGASLFF